MTKKGVVHGFQHQGEPTVRAVAGIKGLIENAAKIATMPHEPANENFKSVHTFVAPLKIAGKLYAVKLTAKEEWSGKMNLYDHQALEMPDGIYESTSDKSDSIHRPASGDLSIEQLLTAFNGKNSKYIASKIIDSNGEPLVVYHGTDADIEKFATEKAGENGIASGLGSFFTDNSTYASEYAEKLGGNVIPVICGLFFFKNSRCVCVSFSAGETVKPSHQVGE